MAVESPEVITTPRRLSPQTWRHLEGWGMAVDGMANVFQPRDPEEISKLFEMARENGKTIGFRGGGRSYGDAALNNDQVVIDLSQMNRVISFDPDSGVVELEPGVTIEKLWKHIIPHGWWPPVVSGTMYTTMAGCASMNIHGKNCFKYGPFGDHVLEFDIILPSGEKRTCTPESEPELFYSAISGFGMLGCFTRVVLQLKKVYSGNLLVEAFNTKSIGHMVEEFEERVPDSDYLVGWMDCIAPGRSMGRGIVHRAQYLPEGSDSNWRESCRVAAQELPTSIFGVPKSLMWFPLSFFVNNLGMGLVNTAKYCAGYLMPQGHTHLQAHAAFAFLLDYVPNWKWSYRPGGLIQYQSFLPKETAEETYKTLLRMSKEAGLPSYLGVFKKHRPDKFLMTHSVDGYSLALDYRVTVGNREKLWNLCHRMDEVVLENGGKFYFAKDATLRKGTADRFIPADDLSKFKAIKKKHDPENLLQTELSKRIFGDAIS